MNNFKLRSMMKAWWLSMQGGYCLGCQLWDRNTKWLCPSCFEALPWIPSACHRCASPLPVAASLCGQCQDWPDIYTSALFSYEGLLSTWIQQVKYGKRWALGQALGQMMADTMAPVEQQRVVVWVPTPRRTLIKRGFNFAWLLAQALCETYQLSFAQPFYVVKSTGSQARLSKKDRHEHAQTRFALHPAFNVSKVLLVDDVLTTGATCLSLVRLLKNQGITDIQVRVLARTI